MKTAVVLCCLATAMMATASPLQMNWRTGGNTTNVTDIHFSADGSRLLTCAGSQMKLYRPSDRVLIWWSSGKDSNDYQSVAPTPDGTSFFVTQKSNAGNRIERRSFVDGTLIEQFPIDTTWTDVVAASTTRLYLSNGLEIREYKKSGSVWSKTYTWTKTGSNFKVLAIDPSGQWLAEAAGDNIVRIFDTTNHQQAPSHSLSMSLYSNQLAFSPDGTSLAVNSFYQGITTIKVSDWSIGPTYKFGQSVYGVAWYPDSKSYGVVYNFGAFYKYAKVKAADGSQTFTSPNLPLDDPSNNLVSISPTTSEAAFQDGHRVKLWSGANVDWDYLPGQNRPVKSIDYWYDDSLMFTCDDQRTAASWDSTTGLLKRVFNVPDTITGMGTGGGYLMTATYTNVYFWNPLSGANVDHISVMANYGDYPSIAVSRGAVGTYGTVLAARVGTGVQLYRVNTRTSIGTLNQTKTVDRILFSNDSTHLFTVMGGDIWGWKLSNLMIPETKVNVVSFDDICVSPDGSTVYVMRRNENDVRVYHRNGATFKLGVTKLLDATYYNKRMSISSDGTILAFACQGGLFEPATSKIELYSTATMNLLQSNENGLIDAPSVVCFSRFDQYMGFGETNRDLGMLYQTWSPYRKAEPWTVSISPAIVKGGQASTGKVTLTTSAPAGGLTVNLTSGDASKAKPHVATVFIPAGGKTANFQIDTFATNTPVLISINATVHRRASCSIHVNP